MVSLIRVENHKIRGSTGGNAMCLTRIERDTITAIYDWKWYKKDILAKYEQINNDIVNLTPRVIYGEEIPSYQHWANQFSVEQRGDRFPPANTWFKEITGATWLKKREMKIKKFRLYPTIVSWDAPPVGTVFDPEVDHKIRFSNRSISAEHGYTFNIWNESALVFILGDAVNREAYYHAGENGGSSWTTFVIGGNVTLKTWRASIFRGASDDMSIAINILGNLTIEGSVSDFMSSIRGFCLAMVHDGATLTFTQSGGQRRGTLITFGSGRVVGL